MSLLEHHHHAHVIGAGGIGVSAVAKLLAHAGMTVTGSDTALGETTQELELAGIHVRKGHAAGNLPKDADLVVYSDAVPESNPERAEAARRGIRTLSYFDFIGEYSKEKRTIAVSGTNGKSTTTALLGLIMERAGLEPTVIVGSKVRAFPDRNLRLGRGEYFVVEACEYRANMLKLHPQMIVLTNIEEDHLDYYRDLAHIRETFQTYVEKLPPDGALILNADDHVSFAEIEPKTSFVTYGMANPADYVARDLEVADGRQRFGVFRTADREESLGAFDLGVPGAFNVMNALAAATAAFELGVSAEIVREVLHEFPGIWRRFERVGFRNGALVVSDYGHHPTAIRQTLEGARQFFPDQRIILAFQPHQRNRTKKLWNEFVASFDGADVLILAEVFDVAGREEAADAHANSRDLAEAVRQRDETHGTNRQVRYAATIADTQAMIERTAGPDDIVIVMGAGDIYTIAQKLVTL